MMKDQHYPDIERIVSQNHDKIAVLSAKKKWTYHEYFQQLFHIAAGLKIKGIVKGQPIGLDGGINEKFPFLFFALIKAGATVVCLNPKYPSAEQVRQLQEVGGKAMIVPDDTDRHFFHDKIGLFTSQDIFSRATKDAGKDLSLSFDPDQEATIVFTSGSAGLPKGVLHTFSHHVYNALGSNQNITLEAGDRWLLSLPFYHVAGIAILFRTLLSGATAVIPQGSDSLVENIQRYKITHLSLVERQLKQLIDAVEYAPDIISLLKGVLLGGGPIAEKLIKKGIDRGLPLYASYGSTEMASQITTTQAGELTNKPASAGKVLAHRQIKIGSTGRMAVKGETLAKGYIINQKFHDIRDEHGWFQTGDLGSMDKDGSLFIQGRLDTLIISGGENIFPQEIETHLLNYTDISEACVVGVPDEEYGTRPVAFIRCPQHVVADADSLSAYLKKYLPSYKIPDHFLPWPDETYSLKPDRQKLRQLAMKVLAK